MNRDISVLLGRVYSSGPDRWPAIRTLYKLVTPKGYTPYPFEIDWFRVFGSPAEELAFQVIRGAGVNMWPQYPVGGSFVDFGDPYKRIALEVDGAAYHDTERDKRRDHEMFGDGWIVYRVSGAEAYRRTEDNENWVSNTVEGVVSAIKAVHYTRNPVSSHFRTLHEHCLVDCAIDLVASRYL